MSTSVNENPDSSNDPETVPNDAETVGIPLTTPSSSQDGVKQPAGPSSQKPVKEHAADVLQRFGREVHGAESFVAELARRGFKFVMSGAAEADEVKADEVVKEYSGELHTAETFIPTLEQKGITLVRDAQLSGIGGLVSAVTPVEPVANPVPVAQPAASMPEQAGAVVASPDGGK